MRTSTFDKRLYCDLEKLHNIALVPESVAKALTYSDSNNDDPDQIKGKVVIITKNIPLLTFDTL